MIQFKVIVQFKYENEGYVFSESFVFLNSGIHGAVSDDVWTWIEVGPEKAVRIFVTVKNGHIVGGCLSVYSMCDHTEQR